jgi:co-chaperonin GroES (HSP10)
LQNFELYEPVGNQILLIPKQAREQTEAGIYIPEQARHTVTMGTVVKVGKNVPEFAMGDELVYMQHTETPIQVDGRKYLLISSDNVVMVKRVANNPDNDINRLMTQGTFSFEECVRAYYASDGDYDKALALLVQ